MFQPIPNPETHQVAPDYGIYWFKQVGSHQETMRAFTPPDLAYQFSDGTVNQLLKNESPDGAREHYIKLLKAQGFFNPNKPTLLFIHGDQANTIIKHKRIDFCYSYRQTNGEPSPPVNAIEHWKDWNVGIFYWNQFADDVASKRISNLVKAITYPEMKIYSSSNRAHMRWSYLNADGHISFCSATMNHCAPLPQDDQGNTLSVHDILYKAYLNAFPKNYHQEIRISGQSLGTQLAIQLTNDVEHNPEAAKPTQLILMDPYFTPEIHQIKTSTTETSGTARYNYHMAKNFLKKDPQLGFVIYRTSKLSEWPFGDRNKPLESLSAYLQICPSYLNNAYKKQLMVNEHISCAYTYLFSKKFPASIVSVDANTSLDRIHTLMHTKRYCNLSHFNEGCLNVAVNPMNCPIENVF